MAEVGSSERYAFGYQEGAQAYLQLHTLDRCADFLLPHLAPGMSLLDAGCGPGTITVGLAQTVAPGNLVAVDVSSEEVERAGAALAAAGCENARVEEASVLDLPFEKSSFDAVFSQAVIDYLPDPQAAVREFHRVLKPGGVIGLRSPDNDLTVIGPLDPLIEEGMALFRRAVTFMGGDVCRGRYLGQMLKNVGFERIFAVPSYERAQSREEWPTFCHSFASVFDGTRAAEICIQEGWASKARIEEIIDAFEHFGLDSSNCLALPWVGALGFKPA